VLRTALQAKLHRGRVINNDERFTTYVLKIVCAYAAYNNEELRGHQPTNIPADEFNRPRAANSDVVPVGV
jgi:aspartate 1-decarboxylase